MKSRRPGLWVEIALALALITLATIVLNAGVFWLLLRKTEENRRLDLALALSTALSAQLEVEAGRDDRVTGYRKVLSVYQDAGLDVEELYVTDATLKTLASVAGEAPRTPDDGLRAALYGREQYSEIDGMMLSERSVVVTSPIAPRGKAVAALRVRVPLRAPSVPGGPAGFVLAHTIFSGVVIALFGFSLFRRRLIRPVAALQEGTMRIAAGDFGHMVIIDSAREIEELCGALNTMSASLDAYRRRTAEQVERLEKAYDDLRRAQDALVRSEKLAGVGRLAAGLAHEVGNPLAAVAGYVELLLQGLDDPAEERDCLVRSRKELDRIHGIIRELLDYARQGTGRVEDVSIRDAFSEAVDTIRPQPGFRDIEVVVDCPQVDLAVSIERDKLHQVLVNLLLNARDALHGQPGARVRLVAGPVAAAPDRVELRCEDNGPGFSEVAIERAFEPFFTTKDVGTGTGLGLASCLQVVEAAGGTVAAENQPEGGACVRIRLPAA